jgi:hypothetical protein
LQEVIASVPLVNVHVAAFDPHEAQLVPFKPNPLAHVIQDVELQVLQFVPNAVQLPEGLLNKNPTEQDCKIFKVVPDAELVKHVDAPVG